MAAAKIASRPRSLALIGPISFKRSGKRNPA
jgi:hypothetical protein